MKTTEEPTDPILGYKFTPVTRDEFSGMQPASGTFCPISRRMIHGAGCRRGVFHPTVVKLLLIDRTIRELVRIRLHEVERETKGDKL